MRKTYAALYDDRNGGWGRVHKLIDAEAMELAFVDADSAQAQMRAAGERRARRTLEDRAEGNLPNPEIQYPDMDQAAAFACANGACSNPVFEANKIEPAVRRALLP